MKKNVKLVNVIASASFCLKGRLTRKRTETSIACF